MPAGVSGASRGVPDVSTYWGRGPIVAALERFLLEMVDMLPEATYTRRYVTRRRPRRQGKA